MGDINTGKRTNFILGQTLGLAYEKLCPQFHSGHETSNRKLGTDLLAGNKEDPAAHENQAALPLSPGSPSSGEVANIGPAEENIRVRENGNSTKITTISPWSQSIISSIMGASQSTDLTMVGLYRHPIFVQDISQDQSGFTIYSTSPQSADHDIALPPDTEILPVEQSDIRHPLNSIPILPAFSSNPISTSAKPSYEPTSEAVPSFQQNSKVFCSTYKAANQTPRLSGIQNSILQDPHLSDLVPDTPNTPDAPDVPEVPRVPNVAAQVPQEQILIPRVAEVAPFSTTAIHPPIYSPTPYEPYCKYFSSISEVQEHITRVVRGPSVMPQYDATIENALEQKENWIKCLYEAMIDTSDIQDNPTSVAYSRFTNPRRKYYRERDMEARIWILFDIVIDICQNGIRANIQTNDQDHNDFIDRNCTCLERLGAVEEALRKQKSICVDVMEGGPDVGVFANAPKSYAKRKVINRVNNLKKKEYLALGKHKRDEEYASSGVGVNGRKRAKGLHPSPDPPRHPPNHYTVLEAGQRNP
ncbi:hypothetical protein K432DRAFT_423254 [Lepidopterella palustris CBS 459.81]|uniref:Uncharacterized protein n=1 Tax=Lepidopterella palustris CBS 459.81 TaxID=1314670 RepID=A0A8E2JIC4_9PEZI|nr:hypothetical protein K432DRAFT_423254 [Lepidopterella palustris CBS 459.81]